MTVTRSKTGSTPGKPIHPEYVETPGRRGRSRKSMNPNGSLPENEIVKVNGHINPNNMRDVELTAIHEQSAAQPLQVNGERLKINVKENFKIDETGHYEFGGPVGVTAMMIGFPLLMWYMWIGATYYDGNFPLPAEGQSASEFLKHLATLVYTGAYPTLKACAIYWSFFVFEAICYLYMPGIYAKGKPLPSKHNTPLTYYCSGVSSFYLTILVFAVLHVTNVFPLYTLIHEFGSIMTVAILSGYAVSIVAYVSALARGAQHRMTGNHVYDFFMGAELNPRMFGWLDFKMFFEVRLPWFILFLLTAGACAEQYNTFGFVSGELCFLLMAHFLYANACCKGEELITTTWDMYFEKLGFMLTFWNMAGVPLSYCHCTLYLAQHAPSVYQMPRWALAALFVAYIFVYWVWDTANSQKNIFRAEERGTAIQRVAFPQLPWRRVVKPKTIPTKTGDSILCDGWYGYARKIHYTCDLFFAVSWGLATGLGSPFPWFYPVFFACMITHRATRDVQKCRERYGDAWTEYEKRVPYLFIPYIF